MAKQDNPIGKTGKIMEKAGAGYNDTFGSHVENPTQGFENPFFREEERVFDTPEGRDVYSVVNSVFGAKVRSDHSNVMEDELKTVTQANRGDTFGSQKSGRK